MARLGENNRGSKSPSPWRPLHRRGKFMDCGIMAATFINLTTGRAFRIISTEESRELAHLYAPHEPDKRRAQLAACRFMPDSVLFKVQEVTVDLSPFEELAK